MVLNGWHYKDENLILIMVFYTSIKCQSVITTESSGGISSNINIYFKVWSGQKIEKTVKYFWLDAKENRHKDL